MARMTGPWTWARAGVLSACLLVAAGAATGGYLLFVRLSGNFHAVVDGVIYRSAQPRPADLARYQADHGIRTIINLRGRSDNSRWYRDEIAAASTLGIRHVDFRMSASRELTQDEAERLIALMDSAEKPVLIHCNAGADRSGLASALYLAAVAKQGEDAAEAQISLRFGHISLPMTGAYAMDRTFEALEPWLGFPNS